MTHRSSHFGFTLVEVIATMVIFSIISAVMIPLLVSVSDAYAGAAEQRVAAEQLNTAMDRIVRIIREMPAGAVPGEPDIVAAATDHVELGDGTRLERTGTTLMLTTPLEAAAPLCTDVTSFEIEYIGHDGSPLDLGGDDTPGMTQRINIALRARDVEIRTGTLVRVTLGADG